MQNGHKQTKHFSVSSHANQSVCLYYQSCRSDRRVCLLSTCSVCRIDRFYLSCYLLCLCLTGISCLSCFSIGLVLSVFTVCLFWSLLSISFVFRLSTLSHRSEFFFLFSLVYYVFTFCTDHFCLSLLSVSSVCLFHLVCPVCLVFRTDQRSSVLSFTRIRPVCLSIYHVSHVDVVGVV